MRIQTSMNDAKRKAKYKEKQAIVAVKANRLDHARMYVASYTQHMNFVLMCERTNARYGLGAVKGNHSYPPPAHDTASKR